MGVAHSATGDPPFATPVHLAACISGCLVPSMDLRAQACVLGTLGDSRFILQRATWG